MTPGSLALPLGLRRLEASLVEVELVLEGVLGRKRVLPDHLS